ncbi:MAG: branched-chain amino acid ABC transporter permease, partial [Alphaproteobacteria bacterium]|nr:branched-chain amino acid ABC transporter permease [Alphaproteobacteria bacterium]
MADAPPTLPASKAWPEWITGLILLAVLACIPLIAQFMGWGAMTSFLTRIIILAIAAASLNLILGYGGLVSFGHAAFYGAGGYAVGILYHHWAADEPLLGLIPGVSDMAITLPLAIVLNGLLALLLGSISLRTSGVQFIMITLAFAQMLFFLFLSLKVYGGDDGLVVRRRNTLFGYDMRGDAAFYYFVLIIAAAWYAFSARLVNSRFGRVLAGVRQSERRMAAIGIPTYRYKLAAYVIAGMGAGLAGALMANYARFVSPDMLHWIQSGDLMIMVILGGVGTLFGPAAGAFVLIALESVLAAWTEHWQLYLGPVLVVIVLFWRGGLMGLLKKITG